MSKGIAATVIVCVLVVAGAVYFISVSSVPSASVPSVNHTPSPGIADAPITTGEPAAGEIKIFNVSGQNFSFTPDEIRVKKGDKVKVNFTNAGGWPHDFVADAFNARTTQVSAGGSSSVEFVADKTGTFEYYCSVGQHRQNGMKGKLIVE